MNGVIFAALLTVSGPLQADTGSAVDPDPEIIAECRNHPETSCVWITGRLYFPGEPGPYEPNMCERIDSTNGRVVERWPAITVPWPDRSIVCYLREVPLRLWESVLGALRRAWA